MNTTNSTKKKSSQQKTILCEGTYDGCKNKNVKKVECPFMLDLYNTIKMTWLCDHCYQERANDI